MYGIMEDLQVFTKRVFSTRKPAEAVVEER